MTAPYKPPPSGATPSTSGGYNYNPNDPYNLGTLALSPVILAQKDYTTTTHQYNYTPGHGPGVLGPGMLRLNGVGNIPDGGSGMIQTPGNSGMFTPPPGSLVSPGSTSTPHIGNVAETATAYITDWMRQYASPKTRDSFTAVRAALANAGYYGSETWQRVGGRAAGLWDITAIKHAIQDWHTYASSTGAPITFPAWLTQASGTGTVGKGAAQPHVQLMDPTSIRMAAQNAAQAALGQGLSDSQLDTFVKQFQSEQMANANQGGGDIYSTSTKLPGEANAFAQKAEPGEYKSNQRQTFLDTLTNMFAPAQSQRPNMTPTPSA